MCGGLVRYPQAQGDCANRYINSLMHAEATNHDILVTGGV